MKKTELKEIAKEVLKDSIAVAYYKISDNPREYNLTPEEEAQVISYINKYGEAACKAFGKEYITY